MPCRSPQTVSVAQPSTYLSMSQQPQLSNTNQTQQAIQQAHQSQFGSINGRVSAVAQQFNNAQSQPPQQQVSAVAPPLPLQLAAQQNAQSQQNGKRPGAPRDQYTEKALADIKNSLKPFEAADGQTLRPVSSMSTSSSANSVYSDSLQLLQQLSSMDEVSLQFIF